jgi:hypothetical protein
MSRISHTYMSHYKLLLKPFKPLEATPPQKKICLVVRSIRSDHTNFEWQEKTQQLLSVSTSFCLPLSLFLPDLPASAHTESAISLILLAMHLLCRRVCLLLELHQLSQSLLIYKCTPAWRCSRAQTNP